MKQTGSAVQNISYPTTALNNKTK